MNSTEIEWCDFTWNPLIGCSKTSAGCQNCYAETMALRLANMWEKKQQKGTQSYTKVVDKNGWNGNIILDRDKLSAPSKRKKHAKIFVGSMTDLFHENTKWNDVDEVIKVIINNPQHTFMILTKRPQRMKEYFDDRYELNGDFNGELAEKLGDGAIPNLWLGVSVENQKEADERIPLLADTKASVRFLSIEPLLKEVSLFNFLARYHCCTCKTLSLKHEDKCPKCGNSEAGDMYFSPMVDWVIVGGEKGKGSRLFKSEWAEKIYDKCIDSDTSFFFKQRGSNHDFSEELEFEKVKEFPNERS